MNEALEDLIERLAAIEHERWAHWQRYMHDRGLRTEDGGLTIPGDLVSRWERQISTPYAALTEAEKQSDRDQVWKYLPEILRDLERGLLKSGGA